MRRMTAISGLALLLLSVQTGCLRPPKQDYAVEQIPQIESLEEIMRVQAQAMDPLFKKRGQASFTKEEFAQMALAARKVQTTAATVRDKFSQGRKDSFRSYAEDLNKIAGNLLGAAESGDAGLAGVTLNAVRATCRGCHKANR